jgi:hypothetical protein
MNTPEKVILRLADGTFVGLSTEEFEKAEHIMREFLTHCIDKPEFVIENKSLIVHIIATYPVNRTYWLHKLGLHGFNEEDRNRPWFIRPLKETNYNRRLVA